MHSRTHGYYIGYVAEVIKRETFIAMGDIIYLERSATFAIVM
jgi:hypothetical protein